MNKFFNNINPFAHIGRCFIWLLHIDHVKKQKQTNIFYLIALAMKNQLNYCTKKSDVSAIRHSVNAKQHDLYHPSTSTSKSQFPHDYKPNINDLRQLFDDNSRHHAEHKKHHSTHRRSGIYADAKPTMVGDENILELKNGNGHQSHSILSAAIPSTRNIEFERVKQKFDKPSNATGSSARNKKARNFSSFLKFSNKRNECVPNETDASKLSNTVIAVAVNGTSEDVSIGLAATNDKVMTNERLTVNKKKDAYMNSSMNLDGLKVSEDDDDDDVSTTLKRTMRSNTCTA